MTCAGTLARLEASPCLSWDCRSLGRSEARKGLRARSSTVRTVRCTAEEPGRRYPASVPGSLALLAALLSLG